MAFAASAAATSACAQEFTEFDIPPQGLESALYAFAAQSHASLSLPSAGLGRAQSEGVRGRYGDEAGLRRLLNGSGFTFRRVESGAYQIYPSRPGPRVERAPESTSDVIIVTARRPMPLSDLPRSIVQLDSQRLRAAGAHDVGDVPGLAAGFSLTNLGAGRDKFILRGVSDGALSGRAQSTVGIYLDGVRLTYAAPDPDLQLVDVDHVDLLRGPQGALYGAGSIGGIVSIESNAVDLDAFSASTYAAFETTQGGASGSDVELVANAPLIDGRLGLRGVVYRQGVGGWLDNPVTGEANTNGTTRDGARLTGLLRFANWSLSASAVYQAIDSADSQYLVAAADDPVRMANLREPHDNDFLAFGATLRASTALGELTSTSAVVHHRLDSRYDATGGFAALGVVPLVVRPFDEQDTLSIFLNETRLSSAAGAAIPWLIGVFYSDGEYDRDYALRDGVAGIWDAYAYRERRTDAVDEVALFGEVTWPLSRTLTLSTGLRVSRFDVRTRSATQESLLGLSEQFSGSLHKVGFAPDLRLAYQPREHWLFYLSAARGYRGGGFNTGGPIGAPLGPQQPTRAFSGDDLWAFELGGRVSLLHERLSVDAALFHNIWSNVQTDALFANGFAYTGNVGDGDATGFEASIAYRVTDEFSIAANALINETELRQRDPSFLSASPGGFPGAPDFSGGASLRYERPLALASGEASLHAEVDISYVGRSRLDFGPSPSTGGYPSASLRLGLTVGAWDLTAYGSNLGNTEGSTFSFANPYLASGPDLVTPPRPQTIGVSLRRGF